MLSASVKDLFMEVNRRPVSKAMRSLLTCWRSRDPFFQQTILTTRKKGSKKIEPRSVGKMGVMSIFFPGKRAVASRSRIDEIKKWVINEDLYSLSIGRKSSFVWWNNFSTLPARRCSHHDCFFTPFPVFFLRRLFHKISVNGLSFLTPLFYPSLGGVQASFQFLVWSTFPVSKVMLQSGVNEPGTNADPL